MSVAATLSSESSYSHLLWKHCLSLQVVEKAPQVEEEDTSEEVSCNWSYIPICIQFRHSLDSNLTLWTALRRLLTRKRSCLHQH